MPRKSKHQIPEEKLELLRGIIEGHSVQTTADLQDALKSLLGGAIQTMWEEEIGFQIEEKEASQDTMTRETGTKPNGSGAA